MTSRRSQLCRPKALSSMLHDAWIDLGDVLSPPMRQFLSLRTTIHQSMLVPAPSRARFGMPRRADRRLTKVVLTIENVEGIVVRDDAKVGGFNVADIAHLDARHILRLTGHIPVTIDVHVSSPCVTLRTTDDALRLSGW